MIMFNVDKMGHIHYDLSYLMNGAKHVDEFDHSSTEQVELSEYLRFTKVELRPFGHRHQLILCQTVLLLVSRLYENESNGGAGFG